MDSFSHLRKNKEFKEFVESNKGYKLVSEYKNNKTKVKILHEDCGQVFEIVPTKFKFRGSRCPCTRKNNPKTHKSFEKEMKEHMGNDYVLESEYNGIYNNVKVRHLSCGQSFESVARLLITRGKCPNCSGSKGEILVRDILKKHNIEFIEQYRDHDCIYKKHLAFDFYLPEYNIFIEFNGLQHYRFVPSFQSEKTYLEQVERDQLKRDYCKDNNIKLIEIPYNQKNVEEFLIDKIKQN